MHIGSAFDFAHWARVVVVIRVRKCQLEVRSSAWQGNVGNKEVVAINQVKSCLLGTFKMLNVNQCTTTIVLFVSVSTSHFM